MVLCMRELVCRLVGDRLVLVDMLGQDGRLGHGEDGGEKHGWCDDHHG